MTDAPITAPASPAYRHDIHGGAIVAFLLVVLVAIVGTIAVPAIDGRMNKGLRQAVAENCVLSAMPPSCAFVEAGDLPVEYVEPRRLAEQILRVAKSGIDGLEAPVPPAAGRCLRSNGTAYCFPEAAQFHFDYTRGRNGLVPGVPLVVDTVMSKFPGYHDGNPNGTAWQYTKFR